MQRVFSAPFWKNGSFLVLSILLLGMMSAALTAWLYSQHVYTSREAEVINSKGAITALYSQRLTKKILPHQIAKVTFQGSRFLLPCKATVVSVNKTMLGKRALLLVKLECIDLTDKNNPIDGSIRGEESIPGTHCTVTIDTTIPPLP